MILYQEDWLKYPNAIVDYNTKNRTFVRFVKTLHLMGVKNCLFPLALHDQGLQGVDPFDLSISEDLKIRIMIEICDNPWYFVREIVKLPIAGLDGAHIEANRAFIAQWWVRLNNIDAFVMQPRQTGKSVTADTQHIWNTFFRLYKTDQFVLTKDRGLIVKNVLRLKDIRDMLPPYLLVKGKKDKDVEDMINCTVRGNELIFKSGQTDKASAIKAARGFTNEILHIDEVPFIKYAEVMIPAIASSMDDSIMRAMRNGVPYGKLFTTTAGDISLPEGRYAYDLYTSGCSWTEEFYDVENRNVLVDYIKKNTGNPNPLISMTFTHKMLGIADEEMWRRINSVPSTAEDINKDYFLIWGKGGASSIVDASVIDDMVLNQIQPKYNQITETGYLMKWYIDKEDIATYMNTHQFILGIDTSDQIKRDSTAFVLINVQDLSLVASMDINDANIITTANWLASFMRQYPKVTMIIEKKSSAQTFIDTVLLAFMKEGINPFRRIYNHIVDNRNLNQEYFNTIKGSRAIPTSMVEDCRKHFGFNQTGNTRNLLYSQVLQDASAQSRFVLRDIGLINQIATLRVTNDGRIDHVSSGHDDRVMAWLLANWLLRYGKNLDVYGIDSRRVMYNVAQDGKQLTEDDYYEIELVDNLTQEADDIIARIKIEKHPALKLRLQKQLSNINDKLTSYGVEPKTMDEIIKDADNSGRRLLRH